MIKTFIIIYKMEHLVVNSKIFKMIKLILLYINIMEQDNVQIVLIKNIKL